MRREDYLAKWQELPPIKVRLIERTGKCKHEVGDTFRYKNPYSKPSELCNALQHVLELYTWRVALGFPSWEEDDEGVYRIHCPSKTGTVWEMRAVSGDETGGQR